MFSKFKKYIVGFFVLLGGILVAFLSGKSSGRKDEKFKNIKSESKKIKKRIKTSVTGQKAIEKSIRSKEKALLKNPVVKKALSDFHRQTKKTEDAIDKARKAYGLPPIDRSKY